MKRGFVFFFVAALIFFGGHVMAENMVEVLPDSGRYIYETDEIVSVNIPVVSDNQIQEVLVFRNNTVMLRHQVEQWVVDAGFGDGLSVIFAFQEKVSGRYSYHATIRMANGQMFSSKKIELDFVNPSGKQEVGEVKFEKDFFRTWGDSNEDGIPEWSRLTSVTAHPIQKIFFSKTHNLNFQVQHPFQDVEIKTQGITVSSENKEEFPNETRFSYGLIPQHLGWAEIWLDGQKVSRLEFFSTEVILKKILRNAISWSALKAGR